MHVPALCDVEVASGLRRAIRRGVIDTARARAALDDYFALPLRRHEHTTLVPRALTLESFSVHDAVYVVLADDLDAALLTSDQRLARAVAAVAGLGVRLA